MQSNIPLSSMQRNYQSRLLAVQVQFCTLALSLGTTVAVLGDDVALDSDRETVGHSANNRDVTPVNQVLTPFGLQVDLPKMRPQGIALSPDGSLLVVSGKTSELVVLNPQDGSIRQRVHLPNDAQTDPRSDPVSSHILKPDRDGQLRNSAYREGG